MEAWLLVLDSLAMELFSASVSVRRRRVAKQTINLELSSGTVLYAVHVSWPMRWQTLVLAHCLSVVPSVS